jgi:hypothetical protein
MRESVSFLSTIFNNSEDNSFWNYSQGAVKEELIAINLRKVCNSSDTINTYCAQTPSGVYTYFLEQIP